MISAVLVCFNEASELNNCLESIQGFVGEMIVVDLESTDNTDEILEKYKVQKFTHKRLPYADPIRNWAMEKAKGEWVLMLDPDERLTEALKKELLKFVQENNKPDSEYVGVNIPFKNIFFGHWIKHTNFWPDKHIRFFKKGKVVWQDRVHSYPKAEGAILELDNREELAIEHYGYYKRSQFIKKQLKYSTIEAKNRYQSGEHFSIVKLFWMPIREFLARYIKHRGYLDGFDGLFLVAILMFYQVMVQLKLLNLTFSQKT